MSTVEQPCYTLINFPTDNESCNDMQLKMDLEKGDIKTKVEALKKTIGIILSGEKIPGLLMTIIRFVLPLQDHTIKKLLLIFWEIVPKTTPDGKLMQEMILVCDAYRKDLQHPNEFIRGSTLRFLCKLKEPELLEPLMPAIRACLEHRHSYVRRNAVLAIYTIYRNFDFLIPDAPELVSEFLEKEQDMSCKRNAFLMLLHADQDRALSYLSTRLDQVHTFGDILQLVIVELIYKVCVANPSSRSQFIRTVYNLINSSSPAVRYEAAGTLLTLSNAPAAIKAAASCYIELIVKESDNNVKLIVLGRLEALRSEGGEGVERALQDLAMDVLRVLAASDLDVRKKTLELAMDLVSSRNIDEMVQMLRKEAIKSHGSEHEDSAKYRQLLVRTLHRVCIKFPDVAPSVIPVLMEFLSDTNELAAADVLAFVREAIHKFETLRQLIYEKLLEWFPSMRSARVVRAALWVMGEFAESPQQAAAAEKTLLAAIGDLPLVSNSDQQENGPKEPTVDTTPSAPRQLVTSDGTYASQSAFNVPQKSTETSPTQLVRRTLLEGDTFTAACISSALVKLALKQADLEANNRTLYLMACLLNLANNPNVSAKGAMTSDDFEHIVLCMRCISQRPDTISRIYTTESRKALSAMLNERNEIEKSNKEKDKKEKAEVEIEAPITFVQLSGSAQTNVQDMFELSLTRALAGRTVGADDDSVSSSRLSKVTQLTGFSDPVYAEAIVAVNQYDIVLDILVLNQTSDTLQNCSVELATLGDLRLVERPASVVLAPHDFTTIKAHVKVASTENGIIFGNIVYDVSGAASDRNVVVLNDIHIDIMDYIQPAVCTDTEFRHMWAEFEWENKVSVNTNITDLKEYLQHLLGSTNMKCLTPEKALSGQCGFMAANLYARSIFGEDALANLSIEKSLTKADGPVIGHIRIRAKSQGMALSLGDKINMTQKIPQKKAIAAA